VATTTVAAWIPAVRAARTSPLAALRDVSDVSEASRGRRAVRWTVAAALVAAGAAITVDGTANSDPRTGTLTVVAGGIVAFLGVLAAAPIFAGRLAGLIGSVPAKVFGPTVRLAATNTRRNPGRTAVTSVTLMIGVGLMALFAVVVASISATANDQINNHYPVDYVMQGIAYDHDTSPAVPTGYAKALRAMPQFSRVAEVREVTASVGGHRGTIGALDPSATAVFLAHTIKSGRASDLRMGTAIVDVGTPGVRIGNEINVTIGGKRVALRVVGTAATSLPAGGTANVLMSWDELAALSPDGDTAVLAKMADGVGPVAAGDALNRLGADYPLVSVSSVADLRTGLQSSVDGLLALFGGLIGVSVIISLFGIANTLSLSVIERTRESATVRALGLTRRQLGATLLTESVLMALVGVVVGVGFGLIFGPVVIRTAFVAIGPTVVIPWAWLVGLAALATVAAMAAAVLPARRAARSTIVTALADT